VKRPVRRRISHRTAFLGAGSKARRSKKALQLRRILVPVDFSRQSVKALRYALSLAAKFRAEVRLLHVIDPEQEPSPAIIRMPMVTEPETMAMIAEKILRSWAAKFQIPVSAKTCSVQQGRTFKKIVATASEARADLIVLATHGYSGFQHVIHGSTAERVVQHSKCPVLIVRKREREFLEPNARGLDKREKISIKKILAPVDFSTCCLTGVKYAALLAARFHATLRLFHAIHPYAETIGGERIPGETMSLMEAVNEVTRRQMDHLKRSAFLRGVSCEAEIKVASVLDELCSETRGNGIDLIVLSTHGHGGFRLALVGNVVEQAVRRANLPLIVVPSGFRPNK
jgi:nucleotide-binding universal stress UspA family protein